MTTREKLAAMREAEECNAAETARFIAQMQENDRLRHVAELLEQLPDTELVKLLDRITAIQNQSRED